MIFVRELSPEERAELERTARRRHRVVSSRRAAIVLASAQGLTAPQIAQRYRCSVDHVRHVIHNFNEHGLDSLQPAYCGGRPRVFDAAQRDRIVNLALTPPQTAGFPWPCWSLSRLQEALIRLHVVEGISKETIRLVLEEAGVRCRRGRPWTRARRRAAESGAQSPAPDPGTVRH